MSKVCKITGKRPLVANNVSKSNAKTKRRQLPNLQKKRRKLMLADPNAIIIMGGRYPLHLSEKLFDNQEGGKEHENWNRYFVEPGKEILSPEERKKNLSVGFINGVNEILRNKNKVILLYPIPLAGWNVPNKLMNHLPKDDSEIKDYLLENPLTTSYDVYLKRTKESFTMLNKIKDKNLYRVYPHDLFCNNMIINRCTTHDLNTVFYRDESHLSYKGAQMLMIMIEDKIKF